MKPVLRNALIFYSLLLFIWTIYRFATHFSEGTDEFLVKPILWVLPVIFLVRFIEKRSLETIGFKKEGFFENIYLGWGMGAIFATAGIIANALKYHGTLLVPVGIGFFSLLGVILLALATGFTEETLFRGYLMTRLEMILNKPMAANLISALLFTLIHLPMVIFVAEATPLTVIFYEINIFLVGFGNGLVFSRRKSLVAPIMAHMFWIITITLFR